jgi:hypothetical protein
MTQASRLPQLRRVDRGASVHNRRRVTAVALVVGTALLGATLRAPRGSGWFTALGLAVAATWIIARSRVRSRFDHRARKRDRSS